MTDHRTDRNPAAPDSGGARELVAEAIREAIEPEQYRRQPPPERVDAYALHLADALLASPQFARLKREWRAEAEIAGQMKHISAEVARGDVPLSDTEELIADLRARLSHVEAERDNAREALRDRVRAVAPAAIAEGERQAREMEARADGLARLIAEAKAEGEVRGLDQALDILGAFRTLSTESAADDIRSLRELRAALTAEAAQ